MFKVSVYDLRGSWQNMVHVLKMIFINMLSKMYNKVTLE